MATVPKCFSLRNEGLCESFQTLPHGVYYVHLPFRESYASLEQQFVLSLSFDYSYY